MSFAFPSTPEEGTYASILHDEFVTSTNWWINPTGPTDVWTQSATSGDAWNAHAGGSGSGVGPSSGYMQISSGSGSASFAWLRSWAKVPTNGAQIAWEAAGSTYSPMYSSSNYFGLWGGADWPTNNDNPTTMPQYIIVDTDTLYVNNGTGNWYRTLTQIASSPSQIAGIRVSDGKIQLFRVDGTLWGTVSDAPIPTVEWMYPVFGAGKSGTAAREIRLQWVKIGSYSSVRNASFDANPSNIDISTVEPNRTNIIVEAATVNVESRYPSTVAESSSTSVTVDTPFYDTFTGSILSPWGNHWTVGGNSGETTINSGETGTIKSGTSSDNFRWAVSTQSYSGDLEMVFNVRPSPLLNLEAGLVSEEPSFTPSANINNNTKFNSTQGVIILNGGEKVKVTGPGGSGVYTSSSGFRITSVSIIGRRMIAANSAGAVYINVLLPIEQVPTVPLKAFVGVYQSSGGYAGQAVLEDISLKRTVRSAASTVSNFKINTSARSPVVVASKDRTYAPNAVTVDVSSVQPIIKAVQTVHVYYTAQASSLSVLANDATANAVKSLSYPAQSTSVNVNASGHGWHVQRTVGFKADPSVMSLIAGNHLGEGNLVVTINAASSTLEVSTPESSVEAGDSVSTSASSVLIDVASLDARGGDPNKNMLFEAVEAIVLTPNGAYATGGHDEYVSAEPTNINIEMTEPSVSNMTDVLIQAAKIGVNVKLVGFYNREEDKWADWIEATTSKGFGQDVWHRFHEESGTVVRDELVPPDGDSGASLGTYYGNPTFRVSGMLDDRIGVRLNGGGDAIRVGEPTPLYATGAGFGGSGYSQELIFRTTDTGLLMGKVGPDYRVGLTAGIEVRNNGVRVFLGYGEEGWWSLGRFNYIDVPVKVNDGNWHQVLWYQEDPVGMAGAGTWTLMIDGEVRLSRSRLGMLADLAFVDMTWIGGRGDLTGRREHPEVAKIKSLSMDVMEFLNRSWSGFNRDMGARSWRILSGHTIIDAAPAVVNVSGTTESRAKGNAKKMLFLYGLPEATSSYSGDYYQYGRSSWSGAEAHNVAGDHWNAGRGPYGNGYRQEFEQATGSWHGYKTYAVHYYERNKGTATSILKEETSGDQYYMDDITGDMRFIDVNKDLNVDITDFDVIHVISWPSAEADLNRLPQFNTAENFYKAKDEFVKSIRAAVDKGVSLWIADPRMAVDMGIAKGYDIHGIYDERGDALYWPGAKFLSDELNRSKFPGRIDGPHGGAAEYDSFILKERIITSTATGFSEFPTSYVDEFYYSRAYNPRLYDDDTGGINVTHRPDGLTIGSKMASLAAGAGWGTAFGTHTTNDRRRQIGSAVSLWPEDLKGQVIATEDNVVYRGSEPMANPYAKGVTTVLCDRGTIINGRPIGGRIFVEVMDNENPSHSGINQSAPSVDGPEYLKRINGQIDLNYPQPDWDGWSERYYQGNIPWIPELGGYVDPPGTPPYKPYYAEVGEDPTNAPSDVTTVIYPYVGMNARGLNWLGIKPVEEFGSVTVYQESVTVTTTVNKPEVAVVKHNTVGVEAAEVRVEFRKPVGLADPDVTVNAGPVRINVVGGTYQRIVSAGVAVVRLAGTLDSKAEGSGEDYVVYLRNESMTLYLGDD